ncbi:MAG TPA: Gfo/Idh/MocA family oxidoreductase [Thermodesulfovibrionales bacterium]|nr:Gfo/Idh/MocA family oxidoreductase [Thermodesulfovibrionales bacterium]
MPVRVAVVGAGYLGQHHARVYSEIREAELVGVVDIDLERAREVAARYGSRAFSSYKEVLDSSDALSIVVPTTSHYEVALDCIRAGKDVLVEKPMTVTLEQADALIREAKRTGHILQVGHLERYNPGVIALSTMIVKPRFIEALRVSPFLSRAADVDVTLDLMIHDIDVILSLVPSPIKTLHATGFSFITEKIDDARAWIEFENGTVAILTSSRMARDKERKLKVFQEDSYLELDYQKTEIRRYYHPSCGRAHTVTPDPSLCGLKLEVRSESVPGCSVDTIKPEYMEPLKKELTDFIHCIVNGERPKVSGTEGRDALNVALEINSLMR